MHTNWHFPWAQNGIETTLKKATSSENAFTNIIDRDKVAARKRLPANQKSGYWNN